MNVKAPRSAVAGLLLACLLGFSVGTASARSDRGLLGDRTDLVRYLSTHLPAPRGVLTGSCSLKGERGDEPSWLYVVLPNSGRRGFFVDLMADPPYPPAWANGGPLHVLPRSVTVDQAQGGFGLNATYEGAGWWILQHHPKVVATYTQAVAKPPTLRCPDSMTMWEWRFGHRRLVHRNGSR